MNKLKKYQKKSYKRNYNKILTESNLNIENVDHLNIIHTNSRIKINYKFNVSEEYEVNQISYAKQIYKLNKDSINQFLVSLHTNEDKIYNNSTNKIIKQN